MYQQGIVMSVQDGFATVSFERSKTCEHCGACLTLSDGKASLVLKNRVGANVGDTVEIRLHKNSGLFATLIAYVIPLVALLAGVLLGSLISDVMGAVSGIGLAALSFVVIKLFEPRIKSSGTFDPRIERIVH